MRTGVIAALPLIGIVAVFTPAGTFALSETPVYQISPYMVDASGNDLSSVVLGHPVVLYLEVHNNRAESNSAVMIYEVRDSDGFTLYLGWQDVTVGPNGNTVMSQSWLPPKAGEYVLRTFALSALRGEDMRSLTMIHEAPSLVVLSSPASEPPITESTTKTFIIGYKMVIPSENMHRVSVGDFPWMADMIENGEVLVSVNDGKRFIRTSNYPDYEITMEDGTVVNYNINYSERDLIPETPYVKAWGPVEIPEDEQVLDLDAEDNTSLRSAVEDYLQWIEIKSAADDRAISQLVEDDVKYFKFLEDDGTTRFYQIRYISSSQERIN